MRAHRASSQSAAVLAMMGSQPRHGTVLGHGHVAFDDYVLAVTAIGMPRMPNGIEVDVPLRHGQAATIGRGTLEVGEALIAPGALWDAVPHSIELAIRCRPRRPIDPLEVAGRGAGLTPAGDDVLIGYVAGLALISHDPARAGAIAARALNRTTSLSRTLLLHAARGEVPEPVHVLLADADPEPLLAFGHSSGRGILVGLAMAASETDVDAPSVHRTRRVSLADAALPIDVEILIGAKSPLEHPERSFA